MGLRLTRIQVNLRATYYLKGIEAEGQLVDISSGGVGLEVKQIFVEGDILRIKFQAGERLIDFWGIAQNVVGNFVGVKYEEISNDTITDMCKFMGVRVPEYEIIRHNISYTKLQIETLRRINRFLGAECGEQPHLPLLIFRCILHFLKDRKLVNMD